MSYFIVNTAVANVYREAAHISAVVTQALMGETCEILEEKDNWYKIKQWDGYIGWIYYFYGVKQKNKYDTNSILLSTFGTIKSQEDDSVILKIPFGCQLNTVKAKNSLKIYLPDGREGFSKSRFSLTIQDIKRTKIIKTAKRFLGIPYIWGGKTPFGFDCSGLVQTVYKSFGIDLPRDAYQQEDFLSKHSINNDKIKTGDLLFFSENNKVTHVAISTGGLNFINARGFVQEESIDEKNPKFNRKLCDLFLHAVSIEHILR